MEDFEDSTQEMQDVDLGFNGEIFPPKDPNMTLLVDADTIAFNAGLSVETEITICSDQIGQEIDIAGSTTVLTEDMWKFYGGSEDTDALTIYVSAGLESALLKARESIKYLMDKTGCGKVELHFSAKKEHFRYALTPLYKANRVDIHYPQFLHEIKEALVKEFPDSFIHTKWEADDAVVYKKRFWPTRYVMCALDKDVYNSLPGKHFNYYSSTRYNIPMKWVEITEGQAALWPYKQAICGDGTDGVKGCPGIGPKKALNFINESMNERELWEGTLRAFRSVGLTAYDAILSIRLVKMTQLWPIEDQARRVEGEFNAELRLWTPAEVGDTYDYELD